MTTDLVPYTSPPSSLELAPQAWKLAEKIAHTEFVPTALRGKPEAVLACILAGHEAGVPPMAALSKIHIIEGRPAMAAELMRALVLQHGHELEYKEVTATSVTATGRRRGGTRWTDVTWTMDDAKRARLDQKNNWRNDPRAMLIARSTSQLCRMIFPDVLAGISYSLEELRDGADKLEAGAAIGDLDEATDGAPAAPRQTARAARAITRPAPADDPAAPPAPRGEVPGLPGDDDIADAEIVETADAGDATGDGSGFAPLPEGPETGNRKPDPEDDWPSGDWPSEPPPGPDKRFTGPQLIAIKCHDLFAITGSSAEARRARLDIVGAIVGRRIESSNDLTPEETSSVIATLDAWPAGEPPPTLEVGDAGPPPVAPATAEPEPAHDGPAPPPADPPKRVRPSVVPPEEWDGDRWRTVLAERKVKVTEAMREAQRLGGAADPARSIGTLDDIAGSGIAQDLLGFVEDLSLERKAAGK